MLPKSRAWTVVAIAFAVGAYYAWGVRAAGHGFDFGHDLGGYYDYLGRALAHGELHLPIQPDQYKMHDMALFNGRYYLYHGVGPAVMLFTPWRIITGRDLPENFALLLFCFGGFLFSAATLLRLLALAGVKARPLLLAPMLLALGICQGVPYLLNRVWVYEIAIGGGYFCISAAVFFLTMGIEERRSNYWLAASGLMFGLAASCRPHLGLAAAFALAALAFAIIRPRRDALVAFLVPLILVGLAVAAYNYARFGNPFEFGIRYLLAGVNQNRVRLALANVLPGLYYMLFCPPDFSPVFPWVRIAVPCAPALPAGYFLESSVGALLVAPFVLVGFLPIAAARVRMLIWMMLASSGAILLFLATTGWTTQRYEVDFLPLAVLAAVTSFGILIDRSTGFKRTALATALAVSIAYSAVSNLALGVAGPYDEVLKNRPADYLRIARWFSPAAEFRPLLNPALSVDFTAEFPPLANGRREPLLTMGHQSYRYFLYAEHLPGKIRISSQSDRSTIAHEVEMQGALEIRVTYAPESGRMTTSLNGNAVMSHDIGTLVTAPAQITAGENRIDCSVTVRRFSGRIQGVRKTLQAASHLNQIDQELSHM